MRAGAATNLGWATSKDGGRTWRRGLLPRLTTASVPPGPSDRASDPVVAYSVRHGSWLISGLAIQNGVATRLTIHRSRDGLAWSRRSRRGGRADGRAGLRQTVADVRQRHGEPVPRPLLPRLHRSPRTRRDPRRCSGPTTAVLTLVAARDLADPLHRRDPGRAARRTARAQLVGPDRAGASSPSSRPTAAKRWARRCTISDLRTKSAQPFRAPPLVASGARP